MERRLSENILSLSGQRVPYQEVASPTQIPLPTERHAPQLKPDMAGASPTEVPLPIAAGHEAEPATEMPLPSEKVVGTELGSEPGDE
eukprot:913271-Amphidinium_carterae.1